MRVDALSLRCIQYKKYIKPKLVSVKIASMKPDPPISMGTSHSGGRKYYYSFKLSTANWCILESFGGIFLYFLPLVQLSSLVVYISIGSSFCSSNLAAVRFLLMSSFGCILFSLVNTLQAFFLWSKSHNFACLYWLLVVADTASWICYLTILD